MFKTRSSRAALAALSLWSAAVLAQPTPGGYPTPAAVGTPGKSATFPQGTPSPLQPGRDIVRGASANTAGRPTPRDRSFLRRAAQAGLGELKVSRLALQKSRNSIVGDFAQQMVRDHSAINAALLPLATRRQIVLPSGPSAADTAAYNRLARQTGSTFDRNFLFFQRQAHMDALNLFLDASKQADDPEIRAFFEKNSRTISDHLDHVKMLRP